MALTGIQFSPAIPDAAIETTCAATGEPTGELRFYVIEAPVSSALMDRTVDQIARLSQSKAARGILTPDVPGYYTVEVRDVTLSQQLPKYAGEVVAQNSDDDDSLWDEGRLYAKYERVRTQAGRYFWCTTGHVNHEPPNGSYWREDRLTYDSATTYAIYDRVVSGNTVYECIEVPSEATPPPNTTKWKVVAQRVGIWVAQRIARQIGESPSSAVLSLRVYDDRVVDPDIDSAAVKLTPSNDSIAKIGRYHPAVLRVLDLFRAVSGTLFTQTYGTINSANASLLPGYGTWIGYYNAHIALAASKSVHSSADSTNTVPTTPVTTLAGAVTRLNLLRTAIIAHAAYSAKHVTGQTISGTSALTDTKDLEAACQQVGLLYRVLGLHAASASYHGTVEAPGARLADGAAFEWLEAPNTLDDLLTRTDSLTTIYEAHRDKTTQAAAHAAADAENTVSSGSFTTIPGVIQTVNAWADALERHGYNKNADSSDATTAYHTANDPVTKINFRASDIASAARLAEAVIRAYQLHALNSSVHGAAALGAYGGDTLTYSQRLSKAWLDATNRSLESVPERLNSAPVWMAQLGWIV